MTDDAPRAGRPSLSIAVAAAPTAWLAHLLVSYLLVPPACERGSTLPLHVATALAALVAAGGLAVAARSRHGARSEGGAAAFLVRTGLLISPLFLLLIVIGGTSSVLVGPCA